MKGFGQMQRPLLLPFSILYRMVIMIRNLLFDLHILRSTGFSFPIISIGNITVGGTGKTPHVELLIRLFKHDYKLAVLSRGYKRKSSGFVLASRHSFVSDIGDEPLQIKSKFPEIQVAVDKNRVHGVGILMKSTHKPDVIILDDAFQHRYIKPGLSVLLVDYNRPVYYDHMLPAGNLREPWKNIKRADIVIVTKCPAGLLPSERARFTQKLHLHPKQDLFFTAYSCGSIKAIFPQRKRKEEPVTFKQLRKLKAGILLVTGIANPETVLHFLQRNLYVQDSMYFRDHHEFNINDLQAISTRFQSVTGMERYILVTEKDAVKFRELVMEDTLRRAFLYIPVEVKFLAKGEKPFIKRIEKYIRKASR